MSQHDYVIANDSGASVRADINSALQAILSQNSGTSEPTSTSAGTLWLDTTGGAPYTLKIRDAGNNHWLTLASVTDPGADGNLAVSAIEGTNVLSTGESGGSKFLREDGDGTCSWQPSGKILQIKQVFDDTVIERTGDKSSWAAITGMSVTLDNNIQSGSKLFASFSGVYGEAQGVWWAVRTYFTVFQNSTNVIGNQVTSTRDFGLNTVGSTVSSQQYWSETFSASILFTPTGDDTAKKTVSLYWKCQSSASFSSYLNRTGYGSPYTGGACVLTLMEIAG